MTLRAAISVSLDRWREVFAAVDRAFELPPAEREAFVERCSTDDPALGAELQALLASAGDPSLLDSSAAAFAGPLLADAATDTDLVPPESRVGPYRIVDVIGRGGMGAVYLAERADDQYRKRVALKLLPGWSARDEHRVRRFIEERQILAALEHPEIARLLDGGVTADGLPWFAMEYVKGEPIDRYCDEYRLSIDLRLKLFCRVCAAVQHAHRNLVVHRDLKPANILVTGEGAVKLLDFGIAKLLGVEAAGGSDLLTQTGERVMTPLYASPEQVRGEPVSTASDVYALGVLLYELITGRHPYRLQIKRPDGVARAVLEQEPERPSAAVLNSSGAPDDAARATPEQIAEARGTTPTKLSRGLRGDLDAIVLKAMEKDPRHRYGSAEQLETDIRRHLAGLPITARPASRMYEARKFLRRHRVGAAATVGITFLILGFTVITLVQARRIRAHAERIAAEQRKAGSAQQHLLNVFRSAVASPAEGRGVTAREVLDSSAAQIEEDLSGQPAMRARLLTEMGRAYHQLGFGERARDLFSTSAALQRRSGGEPLALASTLVALGGVLLEQRELEGAEAAYEEALSLRRKAVGAGHRDVARALNGLAAVRLAGGRFPEAETLSRRALEIDQRQSGDNHLDVAESFRGVGRALAAAGRYEDAVQLYETALVRLRERHPEDNLDIAGTILDLAQARRGTGDNVIADSLLRYGLALQRRAAAAATQTFTLPPLSSRVEETAKAASRSGTGKPFTSRVVFLSDRDGPDAVGDLGHNEIYGMNPDGSEQRRLTYSNGRVRSPVLSPDGTRIAFAGLRDGALEIFVMSARGGEPVRVTHMFAAGLGAASPTWAPDGKRLAFSSRGEGEIYVINLDGTGLTNLTRHPARDFHPAWSPSGGKIAFVSNRSGGRELYVMNEDGRGQFRLTSNAALKPSSKWGLSPAWSPDGRKIAFTSDRDGNQEIYVINADGTGLTRLTHYDDADGWPSWSPDGSQIAFARRVLGHFQLFVMNADGSSPRRLTELSTVHFNAFPSWGRAP